MLLVDRLDEAAELGPENFLHRPLFRRDDMDLDVARAQRGRDFEADEARAEHDDPPRGLGSFDDRTGVLKRAEHEHVGRLGAGEGRGDGLGAGREKQAIERNGVAVGKLNFMRADVDCSDGRVQTQVDRIVGIKALIAQGQPFFWRVAGEIVFRQIGRSTGGASSLLSMTISPSYFCRRSISAAANPAAPPPTITILFGSSRFRASFFSG